mmetsp:Transcript_16688/g.22420  ORF Transcript_16688/g.22420 Transcript_16688/m.22420 type:complete len:103 (-) Transcript_16688:127-435(-)
MVVPSLGAMVMTPVAPHSLSFRPIVLGPKTRVRVDVPLDSRHTPNLSLDGRKSKLLDQGAFISLTTAKCPFPVITRLRYDLDWFAAISAKLHWNERIRQGFD